ncbi:MAG: dihydrofolate reductase [Verrucomicrobiae bacterium]|nr:dihydrofolate reductase [Verrucomicrobiae bacterium]
MKVSMIAAMDRHRVIAKPEGGLPWKLPRDVKRFRDYCAGKHLLVGRRTFEEMDGWFTDHKPIVLTHSREHDTGLGQTAHTVEEAVTEAFEDGAPELVVVGGGAVFAAALPFADELVLTRVDLEVAGGDDLEDYPRFPDYEAEVEWETIHEEHHEADVENPAAMNFLTLRRVRPSSLRPGRLHLL